MIRLEFTSERIKSSSQKDNPSRRILRLKAAGWHFLQKRKKFENLRLCLTDYVKKMSALLSFYGGHLTLIKDNFGVFSIFYFRQSMITLTQREDNARSKKISGSTVKDMAKIQHFQTCEIFTLSIHLLCFIA